MIVLRSRKEVEAIRSACRTVGEILQRLREKTKPGVSTGDLDRLAEDWTKKAGAEPAFKGYTVGGNTYPSTLCVSINEEVVHGMPSDQRILQDGDIVGLDFGVIRGGYYGDGAITIPVGEITNEADDLIREADRLEAKWADVCEAFADARAPQRLQQEPISAAWPLI